MSLHSKAEFGELAPVLDDAFAHYSRADVAAEARGYRCPERNATAERRAVRYDRLKAQALRLRMREIEIVPVEALPIMVVA